MEHILVKGAPSGLFKIIRKSKQEEAHTRQRNAY